MKEVPLYTVGDATAQAAEEAGFASVFSAKGRVGELAGLLIAQLSPGGGAVLYAAGADRTGDLEGRLVQAGFRCRLQVVYRAEPVDRLDAATAAAITMASAPLAWARIAASMSRADRTSTRSTPGGTSNEIAVSVF